MAKLVFVAADGADRSYRLQTHRPFTIGRDPGNDIILRDPKVSRHHAEIVFERGFFVLHDLSSANGSFVNGKRIRVAPLTHGAQLRLGNSGGKFSEELPTESDASPKLEAIPSTPPPFVLNADATTPHAPPYSAQTLPHELVNADELKKKD